MHDIFSFVIWHSHKTCVKTQFISDIKSYYQTFKTCEVHSHNQNNTGTATDLKQTVKSSKDKSSIRFWI